MSTVPDADEFAEDDELASEELELELIVLLLDELELLDELTADELELLELEELLATLDDELLLTTGAELLVTGGLSELLVPPPPHAERIRLNEIKEYSLVQRMI